MKLKQILTDIEYKSLPTDADAEISEIVTDSRKAVKGTLFVCLVGAVSDGHTFALSAYNLGSRAFLCQKELNLPKDAIQIIVPDTRKILSCCVAEFYRHPEQKLNIIGITGTKGKTSVASYIHNIIKTAGKKCVCVGTVGFVDVNGNISPSRNTTPESTELFAFFNRAVNDGAEYAVIEVSSQSYLAHRVDGITFSVGVFTNLSPDHIGTAEHPDYENYRYCKSCLFENSKISVLNADDAECSFMQSHATGDVILFGNNGEIRAENQRKLNDDEVLGTKFEYIGKDKSFSITVPFPGEFSVYNSLAAATVCDMLKFNEDEIRAGIISAKIPGRFEIYKLPNGAHAVIDYAHNELSLRTALTTLAEYKQNRLICLFGSVGGRTELRRLTLGKAAGECSDYCVITSDNPDFEDENSIISDIEIGIKETACPYICIPDREKAVEYALNYAQCGDIILLAGKGHEDYQLINGVKVPFSERKIILNKITANLPV